jgi:hypothetical protein
MAPTELWIMVSKILKSVSRKRSSVDRFASGGCDYSIWLVIRIFLWCVLDGYSGNVFYEKLQSERGFRRRLGLPFKLISRSQYYKRLKTAAFLRGLLEVLQAGAARALKVLGEEEVRVVAMDLTRIESDSRKDLWGAWGFDSRGYFWGYKLGLIVSKGGVVLGMTLMRANWVEFNVQRQLLKLARGTVLTAFGRLPVQYLVCDAGFDGESTFKDAHRQLHSKVLCPPRRKRNPKAKTARNIYWNNRSRSPHRLRDHALWQEEGSREIYRLRNRIEQVNGQLKDSPLRIDEIPRARRGVKRLRPICLGKLILYNLALSVNAAKGQDIRHIRALVA